jgi:Ca2+-binding EF-hand superfamily protein
MSHRQLATLLLAATVASPVLADDGQHGPREGHRTQVMFQRLDTDRDGRVTREEIDIRVTARFDVLDADGDGLISRDEFAQRSLARFAKADADGDGAITQQEAADARRAWRQKRSAQ